MLLYFSSNYYRLIIINNSSFEYAKIIFLCFRLYTKIYKTLCNIISNQQEIN